MKVILFGATGMVGQGVLRECLIDPDIDLVFAVGRSACGRTDRKLREVVWSNLYDLFPLATELSGFDACFFCLGVSSAGMTEPDYRRVTYDLTLTVAQFLARQNPGMTFVYVSGAGTDANGRSRLMWARVKGETENALRRLPFKAAYMFRPGYIQPMHGVTSKTTSYRMFYALMAPLYPVWKAVLPRYVTSTEQIGRAMIAVARHGAPTPVLETSDINVVDRDRHPGVRSVETKRLAATTLPFQQVDVFTGVPFKGNPVAVVFDGDRVSTAEMQAIASWTNLSETTFVCRPTHPAADYRLRIFTPRTELPFAGHPTIGSAHAALARGLVPKTSRRLVQECGKGLIEIAIDGEELFFAVPAATVRPPDPAQLAQAVEACGLPAGAVICCAIVDMGPAWLTIQLPNRDVVLALTPDMGRLATVAGITGVTVFGACGPGAESDFEVRSFAPKEGVPEDPVCGSGNGSVAVLIQRNGLIAGQAYRASQGRRLDRDGHISVRFGDDGRIWVGGRAISCVSGSLACG
jgi:PhzF family phenazine biosynthesis protein